MAKVIWQFQCKFWGFRSQTYPLRQVPVWANPTTRSSWLEDHTTDPDSHPVRLRLERRCDDGSGCQNVSNNKQERVLYCRSERTARDVFIYAYNLAPGWHHTLRGQWTKQDLPTTKANETYSSRTLDQVADVEVLNFWEAKTDFSQSRRGLKTETFRQGRL